MKLLDKFLARINSKQKIVVAVIIPLVLFALNMKLCSHVGRTFYAGYSLGSEDDSFLSHHFYPTNNPAFDWERTGFIWIAFLLLVGIIEYKIFADRTDNPEKNIQGKAVNISGGAEEGTIDNPIKLSSPDIFGNVNEVYQKLNEKFGLEDVDWFLEDRRKWRNGREMMQIKIAKDGSLKDVYFEKSQEAKGYDLTNLSSEQIQDDAKNAMNDMLMRHLKDELLRRQKDENK